MAVAITRRDLSAGDLRREAARTRDAKAARRMLAIALVLEGRSRGDAAESCGMDRQTLRDWAHRYNAEGIAGLADLPRRNGPKPRLSPEQEAVVAGWAEQGPDLARDGVVRWRCRDLRDRIAREFGVGLHERTVASCWPSSPSGACRCVRSIPGATPRRRRFSERVRRSRDGEPARGGGGQAVEVWFMDEARVGQQGTLTRVWAKRGTRPRALRDRRYAWTWLFGAVCPERGVGAAVVLPHVNIEAMNAHLAEIGRRVAEGSHAVLVLDRAGWHTSPRLRVPENISLLWLPPYAPELNPVEQVWAYLRANFLSHRVWDGYEAIMEACCDAWNRLMNTPERLASITRRAWAKAVTG